MARPFMFAALCYRAHPLKHSSAESIFVSRVRKTAKKIFVNRKIRYQGHSLAEVSLYSVWRQVPKPPPKRFLHIVRSRASSFKWEYPLLSFRSSSSFLRLLPRLLVTYISPFIFPSITCFRRLFLRKMWPIQLAFRFLISCRIFLCSLTLSNTSSFLTAVTIIIIIVVVFQGFKILSIS